MVLILKFVAKSFLEDFFAIITRRCCWKKDSSLCASQDGKALKRSGRPIIDKLQQVIVFIHIYYILLLGFLAEKLNTSKTVGKFVNVF